MGRREQAEDRFRKRLRTEREHRGWSQSDMAKRLSDKGLPVHASTIAKVEAGSRMVRIDEAAAIADIFNISIDSLVGRRSALTNDLAQALQALQEVAQKAMFEVNTTANAVRGRFGDVLDYEFDGRDTLATKCQRVIDATDEAQNALDDLAGFTLPPKTAVRLHDEIVRQAAYDELLKASAAQSQERG